jgi:hypothetical protein
MVSMFLRRACSCFKFQGIFSAWLSTFYLDKSVLCDGHEVVNHIGLEPVAANHGQQLNPVAALFHVNH